MKIAQVAPLWFPVPPRDHGGTERVIATLCDALVERGHEVTLFAASGSRTRARLEDMGPPVGFEKDPPPSLVSARECITLDRVAAMAHEFDIIHCHTELYHAAVLRDHADRLVMTIHWRADEADRQAYFAHFDTLSVIAISDAQGATLPASNRLGTVHHGYPVDYMPFREEPAGHAAFLGRLTDQKGPDRAIRIARAAGLPIRLAGTVDVGNPTYFRREVEPLLGQGAEYIGPVDDAGKRTLLGGACVLLFPIDWPEPFGLVMIEAMACGTPVVAFDHGSVREVIDEGVTGFVVGSEEEAAAAVARAVTLDRRAVRARFEERFGAARMVEGYERLFAKKLGRDVLSE